VVHVVYALSDTIDDLFLSASAGDSHAQFLLGFHFKQYKGDVYSAIHWYKEAIKQNNHNAMYALAAIYYSVPSPIKNLSLAFKFMGAAADYGNPKALYFLALSHLKGEHVLEDFKMAVRYIELAALKDHIQAIYTLAQFYDRGYLVNADKMKACALYRIAKDHGHKLAESRCTYLLFSMSKAEIDQSTAYSQIDHIVVETMPDAA